MGGCDLWFYDTMSVPPCVNWYQSKSPDHSYDPTILATRKMHQHEHVNKSSSRDKSRSSDYSKHVRKSRSKDEVKSSSHSRHVHKVRSRNENRSSSRSPHDHQHSSRDEITFPNYSRMLHLIEGMQKDVGLLRESIIAYFATQHSPVITNSESETLKAASCIPETDKLHVLEDVHKDDLSPQHATPITISPDILVSITEGNEVLSPEDPAPITIPPDTINQAADGDLALITRPPDFISPIVDDQQVEEVHVPSHHYAGDPHLHDIIWCDGLPYQHMLPPSPTRGMLLLLMNCLPSPSPTMQLQSLLHPESLPKIGTIDSLLWKQRPPRRPPER